MTLLYQSVTNFTSLDGSKLVLVAIRGIFLYTYYNYGHSILRTFDVLPNFPFAASEMKCDY